MKRLLCTLLALALLGLAACGKEATEHFRRKQNHNNNTIVPRPESAGGQLFSLIYFENIK
jgi:hypothetical protein